MELFKLFGSILIDDKDAIKSLKDTQKSAKEVNKALNDLGGMASNAGKAIAVGIGAGVTAIGAVVMKTADKLGAIDDAAQKVGMSAEEFQKFAYVAKQSGIEVAQLEGAMIKNQRAFTDAKEGSKAMGEAFSRLGIDISKVGSSSEAFDLVVARLADMKDETQRNAIANDIFGKSYADLTPMLNHGSEGIIAFKNEAVALGGVMSNEAVESGAQFGDQIERLKTSFEGVFAELGVKFMPLLDSFMTWVLDNMPTIQTTVDTVLSAIGNAISWVSDNINWLLPLLAGMLAGFIAFKIITTITTIFGLFQTIVGSATGVMGIFNAVMAANPIVLIALGIGLLIGAIVLLVMNFDKVKQAAQNLWNGIKDIFGKMGEFVKNIFASFKNFIKLPKFEVKGTLNPLKWITEGLPKLNVKWNAEGGIFDSPTIFGTQYGLQGVGEAGPEAIMPLSKLQDLLDMNNGIDYKKLAQELKNAMNGMAVVLDDDKVGEFVDMRFARGVYNV